MRPLILGHSNPHDGRPGALNPTDGAGRRLFELSGMSMEDYEVTFERQNYFDRGFQTFQGRPVLVLGREVWRALGLPRVLWFQRVGQFTLLPHPSGRNRVMNDPKMRQRFREVLCRE